MPILYTFDSTVENWTGTVAGGFGSTFGHDGTTGNPINGSLKAVIGAGGDAEVPNNSATFDSPTIVGQSVGAGQKFSFYYRINNTGATRTFHVTVSLLDASISETIVLPSLSGDSGWRFYQAVISPLVDTNPLQNVRIDATNQDNSTGDFTFYVDTVSVDSNLAQFYQGAGTLDFKFVLPFEGVHPAAFTLDKALGTIVIGSDAPAGVPIASSPSPYVTGTATATNFPTGSTITGLDWI